MLASDTFWDSSVEEMAQGYRWKEEEKHFQCLICGQLFEEGVVYRFDESYLEASKAISRHINSEHGGVFSHLISLDKKLTGLSEQQKSLLQDFFDGKTDEEILAKYPEITSKSTIRSYRFKFGEKFKQAKIFAALMINLHQDTEFIPVHRTARMVDDRYMISQEDIDKLQKTYYKEGVLQRFPVKEKKKLIVLRLMANLFESGKDYTEMEINQQIKEKYHDYVTIRRYLISYGFLNRTPDGRKYWKEWE